MNYCSNCLMLTKEDVCPVCGGSALRFPEADDFCFLAELDDIWAKAAQELLQDNGIACQRLPASGMGLHLRAGKTMRERIYVRYADYEDASAFVRELT